VVSNVLPEISTSGKGIGRGISVKGSTGYCLYSRYSRLYCGCRGKGNGQVSCCYLPEETRTCPCLTNYRLYLPWNGRLFPFPPDRSMVSVSTLQELFFSFPCRDVYPPGRDREKEKRSCFQDVLSLAFTGESKRRDPGKVLQHATSWSFLLPVEICVFTVRQISKEGSSTRPGIGKEKTTNC
jgi:hypothetical protein